MHYITNRKRDKFLTDSIDRKAATVLTEIKPVPEIIKVFPSTRYYGSKKKLLPWIFENIKTLEFKTALDGFGGTASVSLLFKAMGKDVTYHDAFGFNKHVARTVLANQIAVETDNFKKFISDVIPKKGVIYQNFQGFYYTDKENSWLDGFIHKLSSSNLNDEQGALYHYVLFQACLKKRPFNLFHRANLNIRLNKVERSFGNTTTWERSFEELMCQSYQELTKAIFTSKSKINISKASSITKVQAGYDLVYLDPPYINLVEKNNRDDYWRRYHFLEGICKYQDWENLIDLESSIRAINQPKHFLDWGRKKTFKNKLYKLIDKHKNSTVILSYVSEAYPDESDIREYFESLFPKVTVHSTEHNHALCKNKKRELLFIGRP